MCKFVMLFVRHTSQHHNIYIHLPCLHLFCPLYTACIYIKKKCCHDHYHILCCIRIHSRYNDNFEQIEQLSRRADAAENARKHLEQREVEAQSHAARLSALADEQTRRIESLERMLAPSMQVV